MEKLSSAFSADALVSWVKMNRSCFWRIVGLAAACGCMTMAGAVYAFNAYANAIKKTFNLTQSQVEAIASVSNFGANIAFPAGHLQEKVGPTWTLGSGLFLAFLFSMLLWSTKFDISFYTANPWLLHLYFFFAAIGSIFGYMAVLPVNMRNFAVHQRGRIVGILDSFYSVGPAVFAAVYGAGFVLGHVEDEENQNLAGFFLLLAFCYVILFGIGMMFVQIIPSEEADMTENSHLMTPQRSSVMNNTETEEPDIKSEIEVNPYESLTGCQLLHYADFHLIIWPFIMCTSLQLMFINNIPTYLKSFHNETYNVLFTVLAPVMQVLCKLCIGFLSDMTLERIPRVGYQLILYLLQTLFLFLSIFFTGNIIFFLFTTIVVSFANGASWCLSPILLSEKFGTRHFGRNWSYVLIGLGLGGFITQSFFGFIYDLHAEKETNNCYGLFCFQYSFVVALLLSLASTICSFFLYKRWVGSSQKYIAAQ